jgi:hypothetical protein
MRCNMGTQSAPDMTGVRAGPQNKDNTHATRVVNTSSSREGLLHTIQHAVPGFLAASASLRTEAEAHDLDGQSAR